VKVSVTEQDSAHIGGFSRYFVASVKDGGSRSPTAFTFVAED